MPKSLFIIENRTSKIMQFQIEPDCTQFDIEVNATAEISGNFSDEPVTIQFTDDEHIGVFGSIFPGDGEVVVKVGGQVLST